MFVKTFGALFTCAIFVYCETAFVDNLPKCKLDDHECLRNLYETIVRGIGKTGIPELKIPPVDPIEVKNVSVSVLNLVDITLVEAVAKGIRDCVFDKFTINITEERGFQENTCDLTIKGHYKVLSSSPLIKNLLGGDSIHGDGNGKVKIEQLHLKFDFPFYAQKRDDGEIYIKCLYDDIKYEYEIRGNTTFYADNLYFGNEEVSKPIVRFLNDNSNFVMASFGKAFVDKALNDFYFKFAGNFFDVIPTKYYIIDDLTPYAKP